MSSTAPPGPASPLTGGGWQVPPPVSGDAGPGGAVLDIGQSWSRWAPGWLARALGTCGLAEGLPLLTWPDTGDAQEPVDVELFDTLGLRGRDVASAERETGDTGDPGCPAPGRDHSTDRMGGHSVTIRAQAGRRDGTEDRAAFDAGGLQPGLQGGDRVELWVGDCCQLDRLPANGEQEPRPGELDVRAAQRCELTCTECPCVAQKDDGGVPLSTEGLTVHDSHHEPDLGRGDGVNPCAHGWLAQRQESRSVRREKAPMTPERDINITSPSSRAAVRADTPVS